MFAITTRNKLRSRRYAPSMVMAWVRIRQQLARTPGMVAYTTGMTSLTEFFTLTLWEKEIDMTAFMSSDDHRDMMWNVRHWSDSFWSMRWNPTMDESGSWNGENFARQNSLDANGPKYVGPGYMDANQVPEKLRPILRNITRKTEPETLNINAVICRVPTPSLTKIAQFRRALKPRRSERDVLRFKLAVGYGECFLFVVWKENGETNANNLMKAVSDRFPLAWSMRFHATDFEIGHWNQLRFREFEIIETSTKSVI